jgi:DNA-binding response OmpR family regulator
MARKILVVEQDIDAREAMAGDLARAGFMVIAASTYHEARQSLRDHAPALLVTEIRLNGYNGLQLLATNPQPIPAVIVTDYPDTVLEEEARRLDADFLVKPVDPDVLISRIEVALASVPGQGIFSPSRRWYRKTATPGMLAKIGPCEARVLDLSYGGLRLQIEGEVESLPSRFDVVIPNSDLAVEVTTKWKHEASTGFWMCGAELAEQHHVEWRALVDATT